LTPGGEDPHDELSVTEVVLDRASSEQQLTETEAARLQARTGQILRALAAQSPTIRAQLSTSLQTPQESRRPSLSRTSGNVESPRPDTNGTNQTNAVQTDADRRLLSLASSPNMRGALSDFGLQVMTPQGQVRPMYIETADANQINLNLGDVITQIAALQAQLDKCNRELLRYTTKQDEGYAYVTLEGSKSALPTTINFLQGNVIALRNPITHLFPSENLRAKWYDDRLLKETSPNIEDLLRAFRIALPTGGAGGTRTDVRRIIPGMRVKLLLQDTGPSEPGEIIGEFIGYNQAKFFFMDDDGKVASKLFAKIARIIPLIDGDEEPAGELEDIKRIASRIRDPNTRSILLEWMGEDKSSKLEVTFKQPIPRWSMQYALHLEEPSQGEQNDLTDGKDGGDEEDADDEQAAITPHSGEDTRKSDKEDGDKQTDNGKKKDPTPPNAHFEAWAFIFNRTAYDWGAGKTTQVTLKDSGLETEESLEYDLGNVKLESQRAGLFPVQDGNGVKEIPVRAERQTVFDAATQASGDHPRSVLELTQCGAHLVAGRVAVFEGDTLIGDAELDGLDYMSEDSESIKLLEYGTKLGVTVTFGSPGAERPLELVKLDGLRLEYRKARARKYNLTNSMGNRVNLTLKVPTQAGWKYADGDYTVEGGRVSNIELMKGETKTIELTEECAKPVIIEDVRSADLDVLKKIEIDANGCRWMWKLFRQVVAKRKGIDAAESEAAKKQATLERLEDLYAGALDPNSLWKVSEEIANLREDIYAEQEKRSELVNDLNAILLGDSVPKLLPGNCGIYHGVNLGSPDASDRNGKNDELSEYETAVDKTVAWVRCPINWSNLGDFSSDVKKCISMSGMIPYIRVMLCSSESSKGQKKCTLDRITAGEFNVQLQTWGKQAKEQGPLIVEIGIGCDCIRCAGNSRQSGTGDALGNGVPSEPFEPARFIAAYRRAVEQVRDVGGAKNIVWVLHVGPEPNADDRAGKAGDKLKEHYPGADWVDWIAVNCYGTRDKTQNPEPFTAKMDRIYKQLTEFAPAKPVIVAEFGSVLGTQDPTQKEWAESALEEFLKRERWPTVIGFAWQNSSAMGMRVQDTPELQQLFKDKLSKNSNVLQGRE